MSAAEYLRKAVEYDVTGRKLESLKLYETGISALFETYKSETDAAKKKYFQSKISEYMKRAEEIKVKIKERQSRGEMKEKIHILANGTGYGYEQIFGKYLDDGVKEIALEEPYLREYYQLINLVRFCELVVSKCRFLSYISVTTVAIPGTSQHHDQKTAFQALTNDLKSRNITLKFDFSEQLHDRQIILSNGYVIKIGRGLHYFLPADKFCLGQYNYDFRKCKETNVDIFYCPENKTT
ncbi:MIT domain-containing protein 1 [Sitodiplosis mosellana]|uniref:MIT domain-containing protein 1 n=1 Tax=Sitodiplosis mosellana TaxID=263140 RepID=UPI002444653E|nr:MIT domain-containing protein 1 [Sitodiplosis mosellana]